MFIVACLLQDIEAQQCYRSQIPRLGLVTFCPIARRTEIKSSGVSDYCKRYRIIRSNIITSTNSVGKRLHSIADQYNSMMNR
jgi:hypothetical protein